MKLSELFKNCLTAKYEKYGNGVDIFVEKDGESVYIYFEDSDGLSDWQSNLDFFTVRHNGKRAHGGFVNAFKTAEEVLKDTVFSPSFSAFTVVGYSHGAALALLCYEYIWLCRKDVRQSLTGVGFGAPRVFWGIETKKIRKRFENFTVVRNEDDAVTHLPPLLLGYYHTGRMLNLAKKGTYFPTDAHRSENIMKELVAFENGLSSF